ncbi:MAG: flagellar hook-length control protein FliK [Rhodospirillales bacterium]
MDHVTAASSGVAGVAARQQQAGRFATHSQLFDTFQSLVMDMQGKIMDPAKAQQVAARDVARMDRPSENRGDSYRDRSASRQAGREEVETSSRYQERKRQFGDDHEVSQSDDAGRSYGDNRRDDHGDVAASERNSQADNDRGSSDGRRQDAVNRDGNSDRGDNRQNTDGQADVQNANTDTNAGSGGQSDGQAQTQGQNENATLVQASLAGSQVDQILTTVAAQTQGQDVAKQVSQLAQSIGDEVVETVKADPQAGQNQRGLNHELIRANQQAQHIRNIANLHTNGQANGDGAKQAESLLQAQAGKIAEAVGNDTKLMVNINVQDDAAMANGRPLSALSAASALASGQQQSAQSGQQAQNAQQAQIQNPIAQAAMVQSHQNPAQPQASQAQVQTGAATQAQTAAQITADAKGPIQASSGASNAGTHGLNNGDGSATQANANANQAQSSHQAQQAQKSAQQQQPNQAAKNKVVDQVSVQINKAIKAGADKINIRLYPQHLGRVEVRLEVAHDGRTVAMVTADKPETLEMLRRDSDQLSKALQDAGLDMQSGDLNYNLKGQEDGNKQEHVASGNTGGEEVEDDTLESETLDTALAAHEMGVLHNGRIDVRA